MWLQRTIRLAPRPRGSHLTWQGIYLCEHRDHGGSRSLVATAWGDAGAAQPGVS